MKELTGKQILKVSHFLSKNRDLAYQAISGRKFNGKNRFTWVGDLSDAVNICSKILREGEIKTGTRVKFENLDSESQERFPQWLYEMLKYR